MEIRQYAESLLFSSSLEAKLMAPPVLTDVAPGLPLTGILHAPTRPPSLLMDQSPCLPIPKPDTLEGLRARAILLHSFANHELLAIELMALALLKFTAAPTNFRRGLIKAIGEEQQHLQLYRKRINELGYGFGEFPVNGFFWKTLSKMETAEQFLATMSLTFEQANLDYCLYYQELFRRYQDEATASILQVVLEDEIGHVAFGLNWFRRWTDAKLTLWERHGHFLLPPLNRQRAKGKTYAKNLRAELGFDADYIKQLENFTQSTGRASDIYLYHPECEDNLSLAPRAYTAPKLLQAMTRDLDTLPLVFAKQDDIVLVRKQPDSEFLTHLRSAGFLLPQFIRLPDQKGPCPELRDRRIHHLRPWGWCPSSRRLFDRHQITGVGENPGQNLALSQLKQMYSKSTSAIWLGEFIAELGNQQPLAAPPEHVGQVAQDWQSLREKTRNLFDQGFRKIVVKAPLSLAGQNFVFAENFAQVLEQEARLRNLLVRYQHLVVEPWLDKVFDYSLQLDVLPSGDVVHKGYARFLTDPRGRYLGALIGGIFSAVPPPVVQALNQPISGESGFYRLNHLTGRFVGRRLAQMGYSGPVGVDQFVYRDKDKTVRVKPIVEINPRYNMGRLAVELQKKVQPGCFALWQVYSRQDLAVLGFADFSEFKLRVSQEFSRLRHNHRQQLLEGAVWLSDPTPEAQFCALLLVSENLEALQARRARLIV